MPVPTQPITSAAGLQLLLFGPPGSGKSSLLGALVQAADSQSVVLHGKLADDTGRLHELRDKTYAGTPPTGNGEVVPYPAHFLPATGASMPATLLDCDGGLAQQYLTGKRPLVPRDSALARAMLDADTVILTLDAAEGQVETQLATFARFLLLLQETRGRRADVAGLPVYLVLTRCDELARPDDTFLKWLQRIEDAKRRLGERFAAFLARKSAPAFGSINLHLWATAIRRPALADRAEPSAEPYGVAELFRQCLPSAAAFDRREHRSSRRLELSVGTLCFLVLLLVMMATLFAFAQPDTELLRLDERVDSVIPDREAPDARLRLRGDLPERLKELRQIERDPAFSRLPNKTRALVDQAQDELASYLQTRAAYRTEVKHPYQAKNEAEFNQFEKQVREFALPAPYAEAWADTSLVAQLAKVRAEYASVRTAVQEEVRWVQQQIDEGKKLDAEGNQIPAELAAAEATKRQQGRQHAQAWMAAYLRYLDRPLFRLTGDQTLAGTVSFTYADLRKFSAVHTARARWERTRNDLGETYKYISMRMAK